MSVEKLEGKGSFGAGVVTKVDAHGLRIITNNFISKCVEMCRGNRKLIIYKLTVLGLLKIPTT